MSTKSLTIILALATPCLAGSPCAQKFTGHCAQNVVTYAQPVKQVAYVQKQVAYAQPQYDYNFNVGYDVRQQALVAEGIKQAMAAFKAEQTITKTVTKTKFTPLSLEEQQQYRHAPAPQSTPCDNGNCYEQPPASSPQFGTSPQPPQVLPSGDLHPPQSNVTLPPGSNYMSAPQHSVLESKCLSCHNNERAESGFNLLDASPEMLSNAYNRIVEGTMPPESKPALTSHEKEWASFELWKLNNGILAQD